MSHSKLFISGLVDWDCDSNGIWVGLGIEHLSVLINREDLLLGFGGVLKNANRYQFNLAGC